MRVGRISKRLKTIANYIPAGSKVADIGGDHAFLLIHLASEGRLHRGIIGEVNLGPYKNACQNVKKFGFQSVIDVRLGDGLSVFSSTEIDVLVIAGMGGALMSRILEAGKAKVNHVQRMILQPNIGSKNVRSWLQDHDWRLINETLVEEEQMYEVLVAEPGTDEELYQDEMIESDVLLEIGPLLWKENHPLLVKKLQVDLDRKQSVITELDQGTSEMAKRKWEIESQKAKELRKVIRCLSMDMN